MPNGDTETAAPIRRSLSGAAARFLSRHPAWCLALALALSVGAILAARERLSIETDLQALLPQSSEVARSTRQTLAEFGGFDFMYAVVEVDEEGGAELLREVVPRIATALDDQTYFREVTWRLDPDLLELAGPQGRARLAALLTEEDWALLEARTAPRGLRSEALRLRAAANTVGAEPLRAAMEADLLHLSPVLRERVAILRGPLKASVNQGMFLSQDGRMALVLLWPGRSSTDLLFSTQMQRFLAATQRALAERNPDWAGRVRLGFYGAPIESVAEAELVERDAQVTGALALALIVALFAAVFRRPEALVYTLVPSLFGVLWTIGLAALVYGRLTQFTAVFAAILVGLGVDFAIHIYNRFLEEFRKGAGTGASVAVALERTSSGNLASALTTAIAFYAMMATSFLGFKELGFVVGTGILMGLLASLLLLPPLLRVLGPAEKRKLGGRALPRFGMGKIHHLVTSFPRVSMVCVLAVVGILAYQARGATFAPRLDSIRETPYEYERLRERIEARFEMPADQVIFVLEAPTLDEALARNDRLYRNLIASQSVYPLLAVDSLRTLYPSMDSQRNALLRMANANLVTLRGDAERLAREAGLAPAVFDGSLAEIAAFQQVAAEQLAAGRPVIRFGEFRNPVFERQVQMSVYRAADDRYRIVSQAYPPKGGWIAGGASEFAAAVSEDLPAAPEVTGLSIVIAEVERLLQRDLAVMILIMVCSLSLYLLFLYRGDAVLAALALAPPLMGVVCTLGVSKMLGIELNFLNIFAFPVIVGIGIDGSIHFLHRYRQDGRGKLRLIMRNTGRAVMLSGLANAFGFAALITAGFRAVREIGLLIAFGSVATVFLVLLVLPLLLAFRESPGLLFRGGGGDAFG